MSIESAVSGGMDRRDNMCYAVFPSVRVRKETFGLLFYNTEESRLTFVKSGNLLQIETLPHGEKRIAAVVKPETQAKMKRLFYNLLKKGLICES